MRKWTVVVAVILAGATLANGKSTKLVASWKNPQYSGAPFHRVLVLGMSAKPGVRADFEDALSKLTHEDIPFTFEGSAAYERLASLRDPAASAV